MVLPTSGQLSLGDIRTEFDSTGSEVSLSNFYRGGSFVPDTPANAGIPTSGQISLTNFYGGDVTNEVVDLLGGTTAATGAASIVNAGYTFRTDGTLDRDASGVADRVYSFYQNWINTTPSKEYWLKVDPLDGGSVSGDTTGTWLKLADSAGGIGQADREFYIQEGPGTAVTSVDIAVRIAGDQSGTPLLDSANYNIFVEVE